MSQLGMLSLLKNGNNLMGFPMTMHGSRSFSQGVFAVSNLFATVVAPANAMAASLAALPFAPDLIVDKNLTSASAWSYRSAGIGAGKTVTSDSTNGTAIPATWAGYSGTDSIVAYAIAKHQRFFNEVIFATNSSGGATFSHGLDPSVSIGEAVFKSTTAVSPWRTYALGVGGSAYLLLNSASGQTAAAGWFSATSTQITVTGLAASATYVCQLYADDTASDGIIRCGSVTGGASVVTGWRPQMAELKRTAISADWYLFDTARGWAAGADALIRPSATDAQTLGTDFGDPSSTGFSASSTGFGSSALVYRTIRAVGG